jgi:hypothetical protein
VKSNDSTFTALSGAQGLAVGRQIAAQKASSQGLGIEFS